MKIRYEHANGSLEGIDQPESYQSLRRVSCPNEQGVKGRGN